MSADPLHRTTGRLAQRDEPSAVVVSLSDYVIEKCCSRSAKPLPLNLGYMWVAREAELRARQVDYLVHLGNAFLARRQWRA
jgi:hypothetical protein